MTIVFDLDDTISVHKNRDFEHAQPIKETIEKIRQLKDAGCEIVIYSARGQNSCKGDLTLIEERNREQVEAWLAEHGVPYDKLLFGKPLGDLYVDDKGMALTDFLSSEIQQMHGNSGAEIWRIGDHVIKQGARTKEEAEWYRKAGTYGVNAPVVYSQVLDKLDMSYIDGRRASDVELDMDDFRQIIELISGYSDQFQAGYKFDIYKLTERAKKHLEGTGADFSRLFTMLESENEYFRRCASFCHGDLALSNIIFPRERGPRGRLRPYLIDPIVVEGLSSYLLDLAKLRFSMDGGDTFLDPLAIDNSGMLETMDGLLRACEIESETKALETTYWIRLLNYTPEAERREKILEKAKELEAML